MGIAARRRSAFVLFFVFLTVPHVSMADTFFGVVPTGLVELQDYKYPVYLFVPKNYKPDRDYSLIITVPGEGESPEKNIQFWTGVAKRRSMLVLAPTNIWPEELPYTVDSWLLGIKKDVMARYRISSEKIFLIGKEGGSHYASYLGTKYPEEFSAVALLGGSWSGKFQKLIRPESKSRKQRPFFVALKPDQSELMAETQEIAKQFEDKGYPVYLIKLEVGEEFESAEFKKRLLSWLEENAENWQRVVSENRKSWKEKMALWINNLLHV
ncbi:MAG: hypothetical protein Q8R76_12260 [Candidatus Omnitrophota bacterium]|nr:hypothetical protein [Candidatus Omnitrophota bacterium]